MDDGCLLLVIGGSGIDQGGVGGPGTPPLGLVRGSFICIICLYNLISGHQDGAGGDLFVGGIRVVGATGPGPPISSPAWSASHFDV